MKRFFSLIFASVFIISSVFAQVSSNPNDEFYGNAVIWEIQGLVDSLPQVRPYPLHIIKNILETVINSEEAGETAVATAKSEYERIFGRAWHLETQGNGSLVRKNDSNELILDGDFHVQGDFPLLKYAGLSYSAGVFGVKGTEQGKLPLNTNIAHDAVQDPVGFGPITAYVDVNTNLFFGNEKIFGTAGVNRFGFGPFWQEGLALNDTAYHSSGLSYTYNFLPGFSFSQVYTSLGATNNVGEELFSSKFLSLHSLRWMPSKKLSLSYYENVVFGRRNELSYLFPVPYMINQGINGCNDNLQMGVLFETRPIDGLKISGDFFVDDFALNFKSLDDKYRFAVSLGSQYAPKDMFLSLVDLNYSIVMPFVYAHWDYDDYKDYRMAGNTINYQNYTNNGISMGSALDPDSDRIKLNLKFRPVNNLDLNFSASFTRHQNVCESFSDEEAFAFLRSEPGKYKTDGKIFTHQRIDKEDAKDFMNKNGDYAYFLESAWDHLSFMTGDHTKTSLNLGLDGNYTIHSSKAGTFKIGLSYNFEMIKNDGVDNDLFPGQGDALKEGIIDGTYTWHDKTYSSAEEVVKKARQDWAANLHDSFNHYITLSFTYIW